MKIINKPIRIYIMASGLIQPVNEGYSSYQEFHSIISNILQWKYYNGQTEIDW